MVEQTEPWMRGTHGDLDVVRRAAVHALELAVEDVAKWCVGLTDAELFARPGGAASVAFHLRHIVRSLDRLLTYAEGGELSEGQMGLLRSEMDAGSAAEVLAEFGEGLRAAVGRVPFAPEMYEERREVGRKKLSATVGGLLIHCAEHTSRHVGQAVTTAKVVQSSVGTTLP